LASCLRFELYASRGDHLAGSCSTTILASCFGSGQCLDAGVGHNETEVDLALGHAPHIVTLSTLAPVSIIDTLAFDNSFLIAFDIATASK
jgi:hypothetical protein